MGNHQTCTRVWHSYPGQGCNHTLQPLWPPNAHWSSLWQTWAGLSDRAQWSTHLVLYHTGPPYRTRYTGTVQVGHGYRCYHVCSSPGHTHLKQKQPTVVCRKLNISCSFIHWTKKQYKINKTFLFHQIQIKHYACFPISTSQSFSYKSCNKQTPSVIKTYWHHLNIASLLGGAF